MINKFKLKVFEEFVATKKQTSVNEAFSAANLEKAFALIASYLERQMGETLYPYPEVEVFSKNDGTSGFGKRYFTDSAKSIRINHEDGESSDIVSLDYWDGSSTEPVWTIDTHGESMARVLPRVAALLVDPESAALVPEEVSEAKVTDATIKKIIHLGNTMSAKAIAAEVGTSPKNVRDILRENGVVGARSAAKEKRQEPQSEIDMIFNGEASLKDKVKLLDEIMEDIEDVVRGVASGNVNGLMISGKAGTGKTFTVTNTLDKIGSRYHMVSGSASTPGIIRELYNNQTGIVVFDDCDSVFDDQESRNIFKAALDTKRVRTVAYKKQNPNFYDPNKITDPEQLEAYEAAGRIPNEFEFVGQVIFISNLKKEKLDPDGAIRSRSLIIDVSPDDMTIMERMKAMLKYIEPMDMDMKEKLEVFDFIKSSKNVSMRTFVKAANFKRTGAKNWQRILQRYI
jgi:hypothetical protein